MSGVFSLQNFGRIWRKKEPDAQKPRLNKACSGRAAPRGPGSRTVLRELTQPGCWVTGGAGAVPGEVTQKGPFVPPAHVQAA